MRAIKLWKIKRRREGGSTQKERLDKGNGVRVHQFERLKIRRETNGEGAAATFSMWGNTYDEDGRRVALMEGRSREASS